ncbi:hypothetical protein D3C78_1776480 [compost metagenome]
MALGLGPFHQLAGAVDGVGFFVIGDGDKKCASILMKSASSCDESCQPRLHICRPTAIKLAIGFTGDEGV